MILIWDTCALNSVCRAIAHHIKYTAAPEMLLMSQGQEFLETLEDIVTELQSRCGHANYTSDLVFDLEIDPTAAGSNLRYQDGLLESFCDQGSFTDDWLAVLEHNIATEPVTDEEIEELRPAIQPDPGRRDISLIVVGLKLSNQEGQDCVIVTDDAPLIDGVNGLRSARREVFLTGQQYSTARLTAKLSLEVLRELYVKCGTDHEFWQSAMFSFNIHYTANQGSPEQKQYQTALAFFGKIHSDRQEKEQISDAAEFGEIFGAENG
jgi:hypothetical protein